MANKITCPNCGHSWDKSTSTAKDAHVCHICGKGNVNMKNGGWLNKYETPQAQTGYSTGDIASLPGVRKEIPLSKEQLAKNKKAVEERTKAENAKIVADRKARIKASEEAKKKPFSAKTLAEETQATGDKFRLFPDDPNSFIDDYVNPGVIIGNMASGLGRVPYDVQQGDYGKAAMSVATPLVTGALAGMGAKNAKEFANNLVNPLAGVKDAIKNFGKKPLKSINSDFIDEADFTNLSGYEVVDPETGASKIIYDLDVDDQLIGQDYTKTLPNDESYRNWADIIYPGLSENISPAKLKAAHEKSLEYFKGAPLTGSGGKEHGLFIRNLLSEDIPQFKNPIIRDAEGNQLTQHVRSSNLSNAKTDPEIIQLLEKSGYDPSKLTPKDWNIIDAYSKGYDKSINELLRSNVKSSSIPTSGARRFYKEQADVLKEAILKNKAKEPFQTIRGVYDYPVNLLHPETHEALGKTKLRSELQKGDIFKDESFLSTGIPRDNFSSFGSPMSSEIIDIPGGGVQSIGIPEASSYPHYSGEREVVLPPGLIRRVEELEDINLPLDKGYRFRTSIVNPYALTGAIGGAAATASGIEKKKDGGWLDRFEEGGEYLGTTNKGFNYNGAWGGPSMQNGGVFGKLTFLEPTSKKLPEGYNPKAEGYSTEYATSIGGGDGEPAYLIPTFKYGKLLDDPETEFRRTGEHLGGPFKTYQEAEEWERTVRHPYVEKGQSIPTPIKRWGKDFAMGGSLPGPTGMMYGRTQGSAPANGKYTKKTMASAQNGASIPVIEDIGDFKEGVWVPDLKAMAKEAKKLGVKKIKTKSGSILYFNDKWEVVGADDAPSAQNGKEIRAVSDNTRVKPIVTDEPVAKSKEKGNWLNKLVAENIYPYGGFGHGESEYKIDNFVQRDLSQQFRDKKINIKQYKEKLAQLAYNKEGKKLSENLDKNRSIPTVDPANLNASYDALYIHQGLPQKHNSFVKSQYKPTDSKDPNSTYYSLSPSLEKEIVEDLTSYGNKDFINSSDKTKKVKGSLVAQGSLKNFKYSKGKDEKGDYVSYYDINDYDNPLDWIGNPFEIYGRIYIDPKTGKPKMQNGGEMKYYQEGLDWKPRNISKQGSKIKKDDNGYWNPDNWGKPVEIGSNNITMQGVNQPLIGVSDTGDTKMMYPGKDYKFKGKKVTEYPVSKKWLEKYK